MVQTGDELLEKLDQFQNQVRSDSGRGAKIIESEDHIFIYKIDYANRRTLTIQAVLLTSEIDLDLTGGPGQRFRYFGTPALNLVKVKSNFDFIVRGLNANLSLQSCELSKNLNVHGQAQQQGLSVLDSSLGTFLFPLVKKSRVVLRNSKFDRLKFESDFSPNELFIEKLVIEHDAYYMYRKFRIVAEELKDKIQAVDLYNLELSAYIKEGKKPVVTVDWWVHNLNKINDHGRDFITPIFVAYIVNLGLLTCVLGVDQNFEFFVTAININPLTSYVNEGSGTLVTAIDGLRRMLMTVFIWLTVGPLRKFNYKFPS